METTIHERGLCVNGKTKKTKKLLKNADRPTHKHLRL